MKKYLLIVSVLIIGLICLSCSNQRKNGEWRYLEEAKRYNVKVAGEFHESNMKPEKSEFYIELESTMLRIITKQHFGVFKSDDTWKVTFDFGNNKSEDYYTNLIFNSSEFKGIFFKYDWQNYEDILNQLLKNDNAKIEISNENNHGYYFTINKFDLKKFRELYQKNGLK